MPSLAGRPAGTQLCSDAVWLGEEAGHYALCLPGSCPNPSCQNEAVPPPCTHLLGVDALLILNSEQKIGGYLSALQNQKIGRSQRTGCWCQVGGLELSGDHAHRPEGHFTAPWPAGRTLAFSPS